MSMDVAKAASMFAVGRTPEFLTNALGDEQRQVIAYDGPVVIRRPRVRIHFRHGFSGCASLSSNCLNDFLYIGLCHGTLSGGWMETERKLAEVSLQDAEDGDAN